MKLKKSVAHRLSLKGHGTRDIEVSGRLSVVDFPHLKKALCLDFDIGSELKSEAIRVAISPADFSTFMSAMLEFDRDITLKAFAKAILGTTPD